MILNQKEKQILDILKKDPYLSQQKISEEVGLSRSATANLITQLVNKGFIIGKAYVLNQQLDDLVVCIGATSVDYKFTSEEKLELHTSNPVTSQVSAGGVMRNIAENLGRLEVNASLLSIIGGDQMGDLIVEEANGLFQTHKIGRHPMRRTAAYYAILDENRDLLLGLADMSINQFMDKAWINSHRNYLRQAGIIMIDMNVEKECLAEVIRFTREDSTPLIIVGVSTSKMNNLPDDFQKVDLGIFNLKESQAYFKTDEDSVTLAKKWIKAGFLEVIITNGTKNIVYANSHRRISSYKIKPEKNIVDVTGAGDAFVAGLVYGIRNNKPPSQSIIYGKANSALTIRSKNSVNDELTPQILEKEVENQK